MTEKPIAVLITDDHSIVRKGIRALLATEPDISVVGEAGDGLEAVAQAERLRPDVILMDMVMPRNGWHRGHPAHHEPATGAPHPGADQLRRG